MKIKSSKSLVLPFILVFISVACNSGVPTKEVLDEKSYELLLNCFTVERNFRYDLPLVGCKYDYLIKNALVSTELFVDLCGGEGRVIFGADYQERSEDTEAIKFDNDFFTATNTHIYFTYHGKFELVKYPEYPVLDPLRGNELTITVRRGERNCVVTDFDIHDTVEP